MRKIIVVGGSSGIGLETALKLKTQGKDVTVISRSSNSLLTDKGISHLEADVLKDELSSLPWPDIIDGIIYCPGSIDLKPFHVLKPANFQDDFNINLIGAVRVLQALLPKLKIGDQPSVVLFSTVAVQLGLNFHSSIAAAKGAVEGLTRSLAAEWAPKIRVNCIAPSLTQTPLAARLVSSEDKKKSAASRHPLKRIGEAADIAAMATFLLNPESGWMTGQVIGVDGGMSTLNI